MKLPLHPNLVTLHSAAAACTAQHHKRGPRTWAQLKVLTTMLCGCEHSNAEACKRFCAQLMVPHWSSAPYLPAPAWKLDYPGPLAVPPLPTCCVTVNLVKHVKQLRPFWFEIAARYHPQRLTHASGQRPSRRPTSPISWSTSGASHLVQEGAPAAQRAREFASSMREMRHAQSDPTYTMARKTNRINQVHSTTMHMSTCS
jgi:hypothetical protein